MYTYTTLHSVLGCPTVNMGILWSRNQLNGYETVLEMFMFITLVEFMYGFLSPNKSISDCPNMSNSNVMKKFACGLLSLKTNVQIILKN